MASTDTERPVLLHAYYQGRVRVEVLGRATVFGRDYYEIRTEDGKIKTVPASMCTKEYIKDKEKNDKAKP